jgi:peroxiredoxin
MGWRDPAWIPTGGDIMHPDLVAGKRFPDLELPDHAGHVRRLSELTGGDPMILNFYRGWW